MKDYMLGMKTNKLLRVCGNKPHRDMLAYFLLPISSSPSILGACVKDSRVAQTRVEDKNYAAIGSDDQERISGVGCISKNTGCREV